jgi:hypothetical protein
VGLENACQALAKCHWFSVELPDFAPIDSLPNLSAKRIGNVFGEVAVVFLLPEL